MNFTRIILFLIAFYPFLIFSQLLSDETIFGLNIADYSSTIESIKEIDSLILINKKLLIEDVENKSNFLEAQSHFETDESYIRRVYDEVYNDFSYFSHEYGKKIETSNFVIFQEKIQNLVSKKILLKNNVFIGTDISIEFIDSLYDANRGKWLVRGRHNVSDIIGQNVPDKKINDFEIEISPSSARYLFDNISSLNYRGIYSLKYGKVVLVGIQILLPYRTTPYSTISHTFPEFNFFTLENPITPSSEYITKKSRDNDSVFIKQISPERISTLELSNNDKFIAFGGNQSLFIYSMESGKTDTILYHTTFSLDHIVSNIGSRRGYLNHRYLSYVQNNSNDWIGHNIVGRNKNYMLKSTINVKEIEFSPNDSTLILSLEYYKGRPIYRELLSYNLYSKKFSHIAISSGVNGAPYRKITFPYLDNNSFYCIDHSNNIIKLDLNSSKIKYYNIKEIDVKDFKLSYDKRFFLVNDSLVYNAKKKLLLIDYKLPAQYYNLFNNYKPPTFVFPLPFSDGSTKNLDIRCPNCSDYFLRLSNNNVFKCNNSYYSCQKSFAIIDEKFIMLDNRIDFSRNNKDLVVNISQDLNSVNITHSISQVCIHNGGYLDKCGNCVGGRSGLLPCKKDCNGDLGGTAFFDDCNVCAEGKTGKIPNIDKDSCGVCYGDNTSCRDCNGVLFGEAFIDICGNCVGGNTSTRPCTKDCNNDYGGNAYTDKCNRCVGGNTYLLPCRKVYSEKNILKAVYHENLDKELLYEENYYDNGTIKNRISYEKINRYEVNYNQEGNLHGKLTYWYANSQIAKKLKYTNGLLSKGTHYNYYFDGGWSEKIVMHNKYGIVYRYNEKGKRIEKFKCERNYLSNIR